MSDFSYYKLYKILNWVQYRDNILRSENISNIQEKQSASGKLYFKFYFYINIIFINIKYYTNQIFKQYFKINIFNINLKFILNY